MDVTNSIDKKHFHAKYGTEEFYISLFLANNNGYCTFLSKNSLMYLEIDDNVFNPFHSATMIINNDQNILEKSESPYIFLGNGRDTLNLEIIPIIKNEFDKDISDKGNLKFLSLKFNFVIIDAVDVVYNNTICKKLMLVEWAQYALSENICNIFGLKQAGAIVGNYMETNAGNGKPSGDIIKAILYAVYNNNNPSDNLFFRDDITNEILFETDSESVINLNPYGVMSYEEVLNYVMTFHSYKKSPCILKYDRFQKKFMLLSLHTIFRSHKKNVIEKLRFPSLSQSNNSNDKSNTERCSIIWETYPITYNESKINDYFNEAPSCKDNVLLSGNSAILSCSRSYKSMMFNSKTLNSDTFMKTYYDLFVEPFKDQFSKNGGGKLEVFPNFYPNPNKKNNFNTYKGVLPPEMDEKKFLNQKLNALLYLNNTYQFKLTGKTHRKSLSFMDVVKTSESTDGRFIPTKWDMNTLGRHFVTSVKHIFEANTYKNEIETIKPYRLVDGTDNGMSLQTFLTKLA